MGEEKRKALHTSIAFSGLGMLLNLLSMAASDVGLSVTATGLFFLGCLFGVAGVASLIAVLLWFGFDP